MVFHKVFDKSVAKTTKSEKLKKMKHHFRQPMISKWLFCNGFFIFNKVNANKSFYMYW